MKYHYNFMPKYGRKLHFWRLFTFTEILWPFFICSYLFNHFSVKQVSSEVVRTLIASSIYKKRHKTVILLSWIGNFWRFVGLFLGKGNWTPHDFRVFNAAFSMLKQSKIKIINYTSFVIVFLYFLQMDNVKYVVKNACIWWYQLFVDTHPRIALSL